MWWVEQHGHMRDVYLVGAGQTPFGSFPDSSYRDLFAEAYHSAIDSTDRPPESEDIDEAIVGPLGVGRRQFGRSGPAVTQRIGLV